ncbi:MAG: C1 family peptidase [Verrucomicrobiota bacterium JB022]|nr:C1 family peptidase [Verrucomicrobiota bacterium JB022]
MPLRLVALSILALISVSQGWAEAFPRGMPKEVDHRAKYAELIYGLENQGMRPSCLIFAVVTCLEFQHYQKTGQQLQLSEDYVLYHAYLDRNEDPFKAVQELGARDAGFNFSEIYGTIRQHGICTYERMPTTVGASSADLVKPDAAALRDARQRQKLHYKLLGNSEDPKAAMLAAMKALQEGQPVVMSAKWPASAGLSRAVLIDTQPPGPGHHAVALVGYQNETGKLEDTVFIFRNSWGRHWGVNGFGFISWSYLADNLDTFIAVSAP